MADKNDIIIITGSIFLVADAIEMFNKKEIDENIL